MTTTATLCQVCGMPLAYDQFIRTGVDAPPTGDTCAHCAAQTAAKLARRPTAQGDNAWVLDQIFSIYRSRLGVRRRVAAALGKLQLRRAERLSTLTRVLASVPVRSAWSRYDVVVLYSGGKDSSYMLLDLARRGLRVCAWMLHQGYQSPAAIKNARALCDRLGVPLVIDEPGKDAMDQLFRIGFDITTKDDPEIVRAAMTYGSACWPCFAALSARATLFCRDNRVPFCFIGTQEGQNRLDLHGEPVLAGNGLPRVNELVQRFMDPFRQHVARRGVAAISVLETGECGTALVPFYEFVKKPPVAQQIEVLRQHGWSPPHNTGACSTNCMVNELGRHVMRSRFGFDLYQVIDAHERRAHNEARPGDSFEGPHVDLESVVRAARMMKLSRREAEKYHVDLEIAHDEEK